MNCPSFAWPFTQGFVLGQLTAVLVAVVFVKLFIFGEKSKASAASTTHKRRRQLRNKRSTVLRNPPPLTNAAILEKTYYNVDAHQPESLDWFNVLIAQTIAQFREEARTDDALLRSLDAALNGPQKPDFLDAIRVTEVNLGEEFPILSNCRICPSEESPPGKLQAQMDVDVRDHITLAIETKLLLNYPRPLMATLPVALAVSIVRFSSTLSISLVGSLEHESRSTTLTFSFSPEFQLDFHIRSLLGSRSRLQDVPKIAQLVEGRLRQWFVERCVEPRIQQIKLPSFWPRRSRTREPTSREGGAHTDPRGSEGTPEPASREIPPAQTPADARFDDGRSTLRHRRSSEVQRDTSEI